MNANLPDTISPEEEEERQLQEALNSEELSPDTLSYSKRNYSKRSSQKTTRNEPSPNDSVINDEEEKSSRDQGLNTFSHTKVPGKTDQVNISPFKKYKASSLQPVKVLSPLKKEELRKSLDLKLYLKKIIAEMGKKIKEMQEGEAFGEKALTNKDATRTTSILASTNCEFLVISKDDYLNIIKKHDKSRSLKMESMLKYIPYVDTISSTEILEDLFFIIKEHDYQRGTIIAEEGNPGKLVFIIVNGYCDLEKTFHIPLHKKKPDSEIIPVKKTIASIGPGSCAGEEIFFDPHQYQYTIKVHNNLSSYLLR